MLEREKKYRGIRQGFVWAQTGQLREDQYVNKDLLTRPVYGGAWRMQ